MPSVVPRQLPSAPANLVGRTSELDDLDACAGRAADGRVLIAVDGPGGVGKTALGASWLWRHECRFPDGQLFVDLGGAGSAGPMSVSEALGRLLRALGVPPEQVPAEVEDRAFLYRSVTARKSMCILLDNAVSSAQARPLIPVSETSAVVVTSRARLVALTLDGASFLDLAPLEEAAGLQLLSSLLGEQRVSQERENALRISRLCSGFPLALSVIAARLIAHPRWTLSDFAVQLWGQTRGLSELALSDDVSVGAVLDACCRDLSTSAMQLYRLLACCPGEDFSREFVAGVAVGIDDIKGSLEDLVESNLIQELGRHRYRYHDLLRLHARRRAEEEESQQERAQMTRRSVEWYLDRAVGADLTVNPQRWRLGPRFDGAVGAFESAETALDWFEQERANLVVAVTEAFELGWDELCWQLCEALWSFFLYRKHYQDWISTHRIGITAAHRCGHRLAESRLRRQLGFAYLDLGEFDAVTELCGPALVLAEAEGHHDSMSTALSQLAKAERSRGNLVAALEYFRRALALAQSSGSRRDIALRLRRIGLVLADLGHATEALDCMQRAVRILEVLGDWRGQARALTFVGQAYRLLGRVGEADAALTEALEVMRESGSGTYQADILWELGILAQRAGNLMAARGFLEEAEALYRDAGHPRWEEARELLSALGSQPG